MVKLADKIFLLIFCSFSFVFLLLYKKPKLHFYFCECLLYCLILFLFLKSVITVFAPLQIVYLYMVLYIIWIVIIQSECLELKIFVDRGWSSASNPASSLPFLKINTYCHLVVRFRKRSHWAFIHVPRSERSANAVCDLVSWQMCEMLLSDLRVVAQREQWDIPQPFTASCKWGGLCLHPSITPPKSH